MGEALSGLILKSSRYLLIGKKTDYVLVSLEWVAI